MGDDGEWKDLMSNGAVMKLVVRPSPVSEKVSPEYKQEVTVHVVGRTQKDPSRVFVDTRASNSPIVTTVGENILDFLPPGVMLCLRTMALGEVARVKLASRFGYGMGAKWLGLESDTDVEYEIELLKIGEHEKEVPEMTMEEFEAKVALYKNRGNEFYKFGELEKAFRCYKEGVRFGDGALQHAEEQGKQLSPGDRVYEDRVACLNNMATVLQQQGKLKEAMETTIQVLEANPKHLKSLVRAGRIAIKQGSHEEAVAAVNAAVEVSPNHPVVIDLKRELAERIAKHKQQEKERWGGFLKPVPKEVAAQVRQNLEMEAAKKLERKEEEEKEVPKDETSDNSTEVIATQDEETNNPANKDVDSKVEDEQEEESPDKGELSLPEKIFTADRLELIARLFVLLSPTLATLMALLLWRLFSI